MTCSMRSCAVEIFVAAELDQLGRPGDPLGEMVDVDVGALELAQDARRVRRAPRRSRAGSVDGVGRCVSAMWSVARWRGDVVGATWCWTVLRIEPSMTRVVSSSPTARSSIERTMVPSAAAGDRPAAGRPAPPGRGRRPGRRRRRADREARSTRRPRALAEAGGGGGEAQPSARCVRRRAARAEAIDPHRQPFVGALDRGVGAAGDAMGGGRTGRWSTWRACRRRRRTIEFHAVSVAAR